MYHESSLKPDDIQALSAPTVLEFGASWCPICQGAQQTISDALAAHPHIQHIMIEDGPGKRLGRSFRVKLWPTLVFLNNGVEVARCVRPQSRDAILDGLAELSR